MEILIMDYFPKSLLIPIKIIAAGIGIIKIAFQNPKLYTKNLRIGRMIKIKPRNILTAINPSLDCFLLIK